MYALSLGVGRIGETLPLPVYALLSGLNASTVGIIALAAVQLAEKAIRDRLTRIQVIFGACAGLCYSSLWYFPVLMACGGILTVIWDGWMGSKMGRIKSKLKRRRQNLQRTAESGSLDSVPVETTGSLQSLQRRHVAARSPAASSVDENSQTDPTSERPRQIDAESVNQYIIRLRTGVTIVVFFFGKRLRWHIW